MEKFPPVRMIVSGRDPLRDENYKLLQRFVYFLERININSKLKKDIHLKEYKRFPHGLWSLATSYGIEECKYAVSDAAAWIKELAAIHEQSKEKSLFGDMLKDFRMLGI